MSAGERQEERWTAQIVSESASASLSVWVRDSQGRYLGKILTENTDDGRRIAAAMVAAPQMEQAHEPNATPPGPEFLLFVADRLVLLGDDPNADFVQALRRKAQKAQAALEAAKRLQP